MATKSGVKRNHFLRRIGFFIERLSIWLDVSIQCRHSTFRMASVHAMRGRY